MDNDNYEVLFCPEDGGFMVYCDICDKLCFQRFYKNHLKSGTHLISFYKRQRLNNRNKKI